VPFARRRRIRPVVIDPATGSQITSGPFIGLALVVSSAFLYGLAFWLVPTWVAALLLMTWLVMLLSCFAWWTPVPHRLVPLGVFSFVWWFATVAAAGVFLDWKA
jgi:hypothetical protein